MPLPLEGRVVALAESRQLEDLASLFATEGATILRCPLVGILDAPDADPVLAWIGDLVADRFALVVFMTGEGVRRLLGFAKRADLRQPFLAALARTRLLTRGPKPVKALKELGLSPYRVAEKPTSDGVVATLRHESLEGATVGVQFHGDIVPTIPDYLAEIGATVAIVQPYIYASATHADAVVDLIRRMAGGGVDLLAITSTPQVERLYEVAAANGLDDELRRGLDATCVAAVGPIAAEALTSRGGRVDIQPEQGFVMRNLVQYVKRELDGKRPRNP